LGVRAALLASCALGLAAPARPAEPAAAPALRLAPDRVRPGDAFLVLVRGAGEPSAEVGGRRLAFAPAPDGWLAVAALPIEAEPGPLEVRVARPEGPLAAVLEVEPGSWVERRIRVSERFVRPPPPSVKRRIEADREAFSRAFSQPPGPFLVDGPFAWPRRAEVTGRFGDRRTLNGRKSSRHYGLDLSGRMGAKVHAAQAGRAVLVRDCWASGRSVVLWHGSDLYTLYLHLQRAAVREGQEVRRGDLVGRVGRSGRVSGPHLHWGVKVGELYVDPESVLRLPLDLAVR
jgi:murein DD-endopeptidase MepM/ murein hydrolase activator NlpD